MKKLLLLTVLFPALAYGEPMVCAVNSQGVDLCAPQPQAVQYTDCGSIIYPDQLITTDFEAEMCNDLKTFGDADTQCSYILDVQNNTIAELYDELDTLTAGLRRYRTVSTRALIRKLKRISKRK